MANKKQSKLSLASINKQHNDEFSSLKREYLSNGAYIDIKQKFKKTDIQRLILDYQDTLEQLRNQDVSWNIAKDVTFVFHMLLLKYFTSLDNIPTEISKMVLVCEKLIDLGLLEEILSLLPQEEMVKLNEEIQKVDQNSKIIGNQIGDMLTQLSLNGTENNA